MAIAEQVKVLSQAIPEEKSRLAARQLERLMDRAFGRISLAEAAIDNFSAGIGVVSSVTAGSSAVTATPTTGAVVVDVVEANFSGIPESAVTGLVADLVARPTGSGTSGRSTRWTGTSIVGNGAFTDDGTNASLGGTLSVTGLATLTGGFTLGANSSANSHKITSLTNGSSAQDAAAFGQIGAAVGAAVSGTANNLAKFTSTNVVGNSLLTDDGTTFAINTNKLTVVEASGNTVIAGTLGVTGDLAVNTNKFTVAASSGNASVAGTLGVTGLATLTAGFSLGADSSAASHKITNLTNGSSAQDAAAFGQIATAINAAISGTANRVAKFTATNVVGNSEFTITDTAGTLTLGDAVATDAVVTNASLRVQSSATAANLTGASFNLTLDDQTAMAQGVGGYLRMKGFVDGSSSNSAAIIRAYKTNGTSGNTEFDLVLGVPANGAAITERLRLPGVSGAGIAVTGTLSASGDVAVNTNKFTVTASNGNTAVAGTLGVSGAATFTSTAAVNGNATLGDNTGVDAHTINGSLSGTSAIATTNAAIVAFTPVAGTTTNLAAVRGNSNGTLDTTAGVLTTFAVVGVASATRSAGANSLTNVGGFFSASGAQVNVALRTDDGSNYLNASSSNTGVGYAAGAALPAKLAVSGAFDNAYTGSTQNAALTTWTASAGTSDSKSGLRVNTNGTYDTTASALIAFGVTSVHSATRSAGANSLTNIAGFFSSSGGQVNIALRTDAGDNYLNGTGGNTSLGVASGGTQSAKLHVVGNGLFTTGLKLVSATGPTITSGTGTPESAVTAPVGSLFLRSDGGAGTTLYVKESGTGNTGWAAK